MKLKLLSSFLIFALLATTVSAESVTPSKNTVTEVMQHYNLQGQNNSLQLACKIGQYVSESYNWNCDIRQLNFTNHAPVYINVFYPAADNKKGYDAYYGWFGPQRKEVKDFFKTDEISDNKVMYYKDWGSDQNNWCGIQGVTGYGIVKSYFGDVQSTDPVEIVEPDESTQPVIINDSHEDEGIVILNSSNSTVQNVDMGNSENNNSVEDSTNTVVNQGIIDTVKQYWFDLKNANLNNVTFNFFGGN